MRRSATALLLFVAVLLLAGCATPERGERPEPPQPQRRTGLTGEPAPEPTSRTTTEETSQPKPEPTQTREPTRAATTGVAGEAAGGAPESGPPFTAAPEARGGEAEAARRISEVRFGEHEGYERVVMEFGSPRSPASGVPEYAFSSPTGEGYGRITFPGVQRTAVSDGDFGGDVMDDFYVVRGPDGSLFVDVFATGAFRYRLFTLSSPARLVLDYRPASVELSYPLPVRGERNVLVRPRPGEAVGGSIPFSGYSRNFEGVTAVILRGQNGQILAREDVRATDWAETWGYFQGSLEAPPFRGEATLQVGSESPRDGTFEGIEVPVVSGG